jgi:hypothetical protein
VVSLADLAVAVLQDRGPLAARQNICIAVSHVVVVLLLVVVELPLPLPLLLAPLFSPSPSLITLLVLPHPLGQLPLSLVPHSIFEIQLLALPVPLLRASALLSLPLELECPVAVLRGVAEFLE